ncbi:hypothetical protein [Myroides fluvii]|uniref:hypothetical protein n=1 Tax=Myroides fluvii TaxID=2572594 RepID=UPI00131A7AF0|nr:hypothetical protein [Myroides fluvii]
MELKSYTDLQKEKQSNHEPIFYSDLLNTLEWKNRRKVILNRDNNICKKCKSEPSEFICGKPYRKTTKEEKEAAIKKYKESDIAKKWFARLGRHAKAAIPISTLTDKPIILHVHHKYYIKGKLPWDYLDDALITLCHGCHQETHDTEEIPVYTDEKMIDKMDLTSCDRCNGSGYLSEFHYYQNGICFKCKGNKFLELI